jgi:hypothetical protein
MFRAAAPLLLHMPRCFLGAALALALGSCGGDTTPMPGKYTRYTTCGDPVCSGWKAKAGVPLCTTEKAGDSCATLNQQCDPKSDCNALLLCSDSDPTKNPGGCPISRRDAKTNIRYLSEDQRRQYADELSRLPLATYTYRSGGPLHLGFVIEDVKPSVSVDSGGSQVDLYGYTSLAVAAIQQQQQRITALEAQLAALEAQLAALRPARLRQPRKP